MGENKVQTTRFVIPLWKKILMSVGVTVVFFVLVEFALAVSGVKPEVYVDDPYVGFSSLAPLFVPDPDGSGTLRTADNKLRLFNAQEFDDDKADGATRIFCVGGSTTFGRPYDDTTSFCGWLRELLPLASPDREWELINAGGISYASYRVAVLMEELIRYQPDFFVVYSGHNEFLERRTYSKIIAMPKALRGFGSLAARTRVHSFIRKVTQQSRRSGEEDAGTELNEEVTTLLDSAVGPSAYSRDDEQRERVLEHYRYNLARMVDIARSVGAEVVLVTPASNLSDCTPFKSEHVDELGEERAAQWNGHMRAISEALKGNDLVLAETEIEKALLIDDRFADMHFHHGRVLQAQGRFEDARRAYDRARDEDVCPLRALGPMADIVTEVAADRGAPLADFNTAVDDVSPNALPGASLFLDHVHPTVRGNLLLARTVVEAMADAGEFGLAPGWGDEQIRAIADRVDASLDTETHGRALAKLSKVLSWAGKVDEALRLARQAVRLNPDDAGAHYQAGLCADLLNQVDLSIAHYRRTIEIDPSIDLAHGNLGVALEKKGDLEGAIRHFRQAVELGTGQDRRRNVGNLADALHHLGAKEVHAGRFEEGVELLDEARRMLPNNTDLLLRLGTAHFGLEDYPAAIEVFTDAAVRAPENAAVHNRLAIACYFGDQRDEAIAAYRRGVSLDPELRQRDGGLESYLRLSGREKEADRIASELLQ